jgi:hypothetical protein
LRVLLSWLTGLFRCPGCEALKSERDFLRGILATTRSFTREVPPTVVHMSKDAEPARTVVIHDEDDKPLPFHRNPVQEMVFEKD